MARDRPDELGQAAAGGGGDCQEGPGRGQAVAADALLLKRLQIFWAKRLQAQTPEVTAPIEEGQRHAA